MQMRLLLGCLGFVLGVSGAQAQSLDLSQRLRLVQDGLVSGQFGVVAQYFHPKLKAEWSASRIANTWNTINYQLGGFTEWGERKQDSTQWNQQPIQVIHQQALFQKGSIWLVISFKDTGDIVGFFLSRDK